MSETETKVVEKIETDLANPTDTVCPPATTSTAKEGISTVCTKCGERPRQRGRTSCSKCRERTKYKLVRVPYGIVPVGNTATDLDGETIFPSGPTRSTKASTYVNTVLGVPEEHVKHITTEGQERTLSTLFIGEHMSCGLETLESKCVIPDHMHDYSEEMINVISGEGMLYINGQKDGVPIEAGSMLFIPPKLTHRIECKSSNPLVFSYTLSPPVKMDKMIAGREKSKPSNKRKQATADGQRKKQKKANSKNKKKEKDLQPAENTPEDNIDDFVETEEL